MDQSSNRMIVTIEGKQETIYVAGPVDDRWVWWNGHVFRLTSETGRARAPRTSRRDSRQEIHAPMPAKVVRVLVTPGAAVQKGDTLIVLEAMKMELPLRSASDATVTAVHCQEGQLVQPDALLAELS